MDPRDEDAALAQLRAVARDALVGAEPAHDFQHVLRVAASARAIADAEGARRLIAESAALLHELYNLPKDHPESSRSGERCAERATVVLHAHGFVPSDAAAISDAIRVHGYSVGIVPASLEARVLQDADRLDAIGAIGIARCFATGAAMRAAFYDADDPLCRTREPDDKRYSVDHFFRKLLKIEGGLHTQTARAMAAQRASFMRQFLAQLEREITG
jgi:uncharacterized protein